MSWICLAFAGALEVVWALGLKHTGGFRRLWPSLVVVAAIAASMALLAVAARRLPIGTAYAVWVGIGVLGTTIGGVVLFGEPLGAARAGWLALLVAAVVGLKLSA